MTTFKLSSSDTVYKRLLENHILTNLLFLLILVMGWLAYYQLPREQDPSVNFYWVQIWAYWPGATAYDVENRITTPLERSIERVEDIKFVSSTSRQGIASILVRFSDIGDAAFDRRLTDLRRELQSTMDELPEGVEPPEIIEISSANAFPTATLVVWGHAEGDRLQRMAQQFLKDLERMEGVDNVAASGISDPELKVHFNPEYLLGLGVSPVNLAESVSAYFRDMAAGDIRIGDQEWLVRISGTSSTPEYLASLPIVTAQGEVPLRSVAEVERGRGDLQAMVRYQGHPAVLLSVFKEDKANNIQLLDRIKAFLAQQNSLSGKTGVEIVLLDDQTQATRAAIDIMERNALFGLLLVVLVTWLVLGFQVALFTGMGIPFVLAGTFWVLSAMGQTLNVTVLLAIVISLGMLVDDALVVVEAINFHVQRGRKKLEAIYEALSEVAAPVTTAVMTTIAAFLPLMLLPGLLGDFMRVVPMVVSIALLVSLVESFWTLPSHMLEFPPKPATHRTQRLRNAVTKRLRRRYAKLLIIVLRHPKLSYSFGVALLVGAVTLVAGGLVKVDFFATDLYRFFYVNVDMPPGTTLEKTSQTLERLDGVIRSRLSDQQNIGMVSYAGQQFTETELLTGHEKGQIFISLNSTSPGSLGVDETIDALRDVVFSVPGPDNVSFLRRKTGPPVAKPVSIKVRGDDIEEVRLAVTTLKDILHTLPGVSDITDDDAEGDKELNMKIDPDAATRAGLRPEELFRSVRLFVDGEVVSSMQYLGEKLDVRVRADPARLQDIESFLAYPVGLPDGGEIPIGALLRHEERDAASNIRHYNFRRSVSIEADLDTNVADTLSTNAEIKRLWAAVGGEFPGVSLDFSGELDDIKESLGAMAALLLLGLGLMYLILGTQFKSYFQPFLVLLTVPMAFIGVAIGLYISGNPLSLFTMYGAIALAGIAVNDAIVLIATANRKLQAGNTGAVAIVLAGRRRVVPILITSITTIAGLFSLATGLGGTSLVWGPVATAIVWGLVFSTILTLFFVPLAYQGVMRRRKTSSNLMYEDLIVKRRMLKGFTNSEDTVWLPKDAIADDEQRKLYIQGVEAANNQDLETAVRLFQELADTTNDSLPFNLAAAQALIMFQQRHGWDFGYTRRTHRYLKRARTLEADNKHLHMLDELLQELEASKEELPDYLKGES